MSKAVNTNCLASMECPGCKSGGPFKISATALFTINDDGTEACGDAECYCACPQCDFEGIIDNFTKGDRA